jgi:hypothetical protein
LFGRRVFVGISGDNPRRDRVKPLPSPNPLELPNLSALISGVREIHQSYTAIFLRFVFFHALEYLSELEILRIMAVYAN